MPPPNGLWQPTPVAGLIDLVKGTLDPHAPELDSGRCLLLLAGHAWEFLWERGRIYDLTRGSW